MKFEIEASWKEQLQDEVEKPYFKKLWNFVQREYRTNTVYPPPEQIFAAFDATPFDKVKVVILGQDPYHGPNQANGLCFSVNDDIRIPPSLKNIYKEIQQDLDKPIPTSGNLDHWATQGILLLNATLTVVHKSPRSHQNKGWEEFTDAVIRILSRERRQLVFLLWGAYAQKKGQVIERQAEHLILQAAHPSPYSATNGFFGCRHFSQTNAFLEKHGIKPIDW